MFKLFHTVRFFFGLLVVLNLLLLLSSPYKTMAASNFLDPTFADKADDLGSSSSPDNANESPDPSSGITNPESSSVQDYDSLKNCSADTSKQPTSIEYLTYFNCGHVKTDSLPGGEKQVTREFTLVVKEDQSIPIANHGLTFDDA